MNITSVTGMRKGKKGQRNDQLIFKGYAMSTLPNFVNAGSTKGRAKQSSSSSQTASSKYIKLDKDKAIDLIPLTGVDPDDGAVPNGKNSVISFREFWTKNPDPQKVNFSFPSIGGEDDPGLMLGYEAKFKGMMLVVEANDNTEKIWTFGISVYKQLGLIEAALGESIRGHILRVLKSGTGFNTKYTVTQTGRVVEIEGEPETDLTKYIGPSTREDIIEALTKAGVWVSNTSPSLPVPKVQATAPQMQRSGYNPNPMNVVNDRFGKATQNKPTVHNVVNPDDVDTVPNAATVPNDIQIKIHETTTTSGMVVNARVDLASLNQESSNHEDVSTQSSKSQPVVNQSANKPSVTNPAKANQSAYASQMHKEKKASDKPVEIEFVAAYQDVNDNDKGDWEDNDPFSDIDFETGV